MRRAEFLRRAAIGGISILSLTGGAVIVAAEGPLTGADQLILVIAETESANQARLATFERNGGAWKRAASLPVVIGKNGMAWGRGLHRDTDRVPGEPVKREGDGKTPSGAFDIHRAFGYPPADSVRTKLPYLRTTPDLIGVDDARSELYNLVVNVREKGLDPEKLPSHEDMLREDELYRYVIPVEHNTRRIERGAGSCIFLHLWRGPDSFTAGCTAMAEADMKALLAWLDPDARPVIVQLTRTGYNRLKGRWGLPSM